MLVLIKLFFISKINMVNNPAEEEGVSKSKFCSQALSKVLLVNNYAHIFILSHYCTLASILVLLNMRNALRKRIYALFFL